MKKLFFFLAAMVLSIAAQAAVHYPTSGGEKQLRNAVRDLAEPGDTIVLADGVYAEPSDIAIEKEGLVIMAAEGAKPIVAIKGWATIQAKASFIINGITFDGMNDAYYFIAIKGSGLYDITLKNCEFTGWKQWAISNQYDAEFTVGKVLVDSCLFHDAPNSAIRFSEKAPEGMHACQHLEVTNSTFSNIGNTSDAYGTVCAISNANAAGVENKVVVDHCTFYNCLAKSTDHAGIYVYGAKGDNVQISNNILALAEAGEKPRAIYSTEYITASNCLTYNYTKDGTGIRSTVTAVNCIHQDPLFVDAVNSNFNLQPGSPAIGAATDGTNIGDPRWKVAAAELTFTMTAPAADVEATDLYTIKWNVLDPAGDATIKLEYKTEEGEWTLIEENIPTTKSAYDWNIRKMAAQTVAIRGTLTNATETIESVAAGKLTIVPEAVAPRPVRNLAGEVAENTLTLTWVNPDQAYEVSETLETLESAESYISNDGTAEVTLSGDKKEVSVAYNTTAAWHMAGVKVPVTADYVNTLACELKRDAADGTQIQVTIEQNGFDWWYLIIDDIATEWTEYEFTEFEKLSWHNNSDAAVLDGTNVTAVYFATNHGSGVTGTLSLRNLTLNGAVPAVTDYAKTVVCASTTDYPTTIVAEDVVYEGAASTCTVEIDPTKDLYVSVFAQDDLGNTSVAAQYKYTAPEVEEPEYDVMDITMTNLVVQEMEDFVVLTASDDENTGLNVMLAVNEDGSLAADSYMALLQGWNETELPIVEGAITKTFNEELATDVYTGLIVVEYMEGKLGLNLTMYAKPIVVTDVVVTDATITVEKLDDGMGVTYENITVSAKWNESVLVIEGVEKAHEGFIQIKETFEVDGEEDWYIWMCMNGVITTVDNVLTVKGEFKNNFTGDVYNVTISGTLPSGATALENLDTTVAPAKAIVNGQLVIVKDGVKYNAQGAVVK